MREQRDEIDPQRLQELLQCSRVPQRYRNASFESFDAYTPSLVTALQSVRRTIEQRRGAVLTGTVGTGKTYLLCAMVREYILRERRCRLFNSNDFICRVTSAYGNALEFIEENVSDHHVIAVDDLAAERQTDAARSHLYHLINFCYTESKRLLITTNLTAQELYTREPRIASRLSEVCEFIQIKGEDYRARIAARRQGRDTNSSTPSECVQ
jgi:DNA replication protein DnaC